MWCQDATLPRLHLAPPPGVVQEETRLDAGDRRRSAEEGEGGKVGAWAVDRRPVQIAHETPQGLTAGSHDAVTRPLHGAFPAKSSLDGSTEPGAPQEGALEENEGGERDDGRDQQGRQEDAELGLALDLRQTDGQRLAVRVVSTRNGQRKSFHDAMTANTETTPMIGLLIGSTIDQNSRNGPAPSTGRPRRSPAAASRRTA